MPQICTTPDNFTLPIYKSDQSFTLSEHEGKVILLSFMNLACGHCWDFFTRWMSIHDDYQTNDLVEVVVVVFNLSGGDVTDEAIDEKLSDEGLTAPGFTLLKNNAFSGTPANTYLNSFTGRVGFPYAFLISMPHLVANKWHSGSSGVDSGEIISFDSSDDEDVEQFIRHRIDDLLVVRDPWNTALVLDYSGSMGDSVTVAGTTKPKVEFLRDAVDAWLRVWKDYAACNDKLGLVYFQSHATCDGSLSPILPGENVEAILTAVQEKNADGCTALGAGIATGIDILETEPGPDDPADPHERHMVVFTDGIQNRNPLVVPTGDCGDDVCYLEWQIRNVSDEDAEFFGYNLCGGNGGQSNYSGTLPRILQDNPMQTAIHTIGIGAPDAAQTLLAKISEPTPGVSYLGSEIWPNLKEFFLESLVESFRGSSLQVVASRAGTLAADQDVSQEVFMLNRTVRKATVVLSWLDEATPLTFDLYKGSGSLNLDRKRTVHPTGSITTIPFPLYQPAAKLGKLLKPRFTNIKVDPSLKPALAPSGLGWAGGMVEAEGGYHLEITRLFPDTTGDVPYHVMVLADDHHVEVDLRLPQQVYYAGERIPLDVVVTDRKVPLDKVFSVDAELRRPIVSFGDVYNQHYKRIIDKLKGNNDDVTVHTVLAAMSRDEKVAAELRKAELDSIRLRPTSKDGHTSTTGRKGVFSHRYNETRTPGHYRIRVRVRGVSATAGTFERLVTKTVLVLPRPDRDRTKIEGSPLPDKKGKIAVTVTPADRHGNLLGPGFSEQVFLVLAGEQCGTIRANLDGTYEVIADLGDHSVDAETVLWVAGERVFTGPVSELVEG